MQNQAARIISALFLSSLPYRKGFLHRIKENQKKFSITENPWDEPNNKKILKTYYGKRWIEYGKRKALNYIEKKKSKFEFDSLLFFDEPEYPRLLKEIYDPPLVLFLKHSIQKENTNFNQYDMISIVGTRKPLSISLLAVDRLIEFFSLLKSSKKLISQLVEWNSHKDLFPQSTKTDNQSSTIATVSGFAKGVDERVHRASVFFSVSTIGILGCGIDEISPKKNKEIFFKAQEEKKEMIFISEFFPTHKPGKYTFPLRNRIIAGFSNYLFIMQAGSKSGALITAEYALQENREIICFDHPLFRNTKHNLGNQMLISDGAHQLKIENL
ncbi:MAG: DNA-protecting protein DprA [Leptospiraceae bacterium]|nr:DNA-protecting protein DprA [Leptospiraceae bacterium]MDW7975366.1 DNA-processing protein DprA [Leptospiraceae bacterium]